MTRQGRKTRENVVACTAAEGYKNLFAALFCNAATIDGITDRTGGLTDDYILGVLYENGSIAYDKKTGVWLPFYGVGVPNSYGNCEKVRLYSNYGGGVNLTRARSDVYIFDANSEAFPISRFVAMRAARLSNFDGAIDQNLDAIKDMSLVVTDNKNLSQQLQNADKKRRNGASVAVINSAQTDGTFGELKTLSTGAEYKVDKLLRDRRAEFEEVLHVVGIRTPTEKAERMITDEVATQNEETDAYIGLMIDTFNRQAEEQNAPFRMRRRKIAEEGTEV